ncbi:MAG: filamentous hemagglutinin N-terminal domain-containing protein [Deltaproteobacteria bacterium]|nr:filamentous hemagglutinin N-terminal domain-containing protein [Deltaproteobacteria bacterium]
MRTKRMNRHLCFWNFSSLLHSWQNHPGRHRRALQSTGMLRRLSRLAPNFPYRRGLLALSLILPATALAGPAGEQVTAGSAIITRPNAVTTQITQQSQKAVIDWQNFSIAGPEMVRFQQPDASSVTLNRVLGNDPSRIFGSLTANGQIFLVNPAGVLFAPGSQVSVQGLLATSHKISNTDFMAGRYSFSQTENELPEAQVINQGNLQANDGGYIVLAGDYATNSGVIQARLGKVALASGNRFTLDLDGDQLIGLAVDQASLARRAGVANFGAIAADGGQVVMTARVANELAGTVVNNTGLVQARSIEERNGEIILHGGTTGIVANTGTLDASGLHSGETGGNVRMLGENVGLLDKAVVDVSGANGGGTTLIGGDYQGKNPAIQNATATYVGKDTAIKADATGNGDGGKVIVWADNTTRAFGRISARGGQDGGAGGLVETSGHYLSVDGVQVNTSSPYGKTGLWLLDPIAINIVSSGVGTLSGGIFDPASSTDISPATITGAGGLLDTNVLIKTTTGGGGTITVTDAIGWNSVNSLSLETDGIIAVNADITNSSTGGVSLTSTGAGITVAASKTISTSGTVQASSAGTFQSGAGSVISGNVVTISTTASGYLTIGGAVTSSPGGSVTLNTVGAYDITTPVGGLITSDTITLQSNGSTGPVGTSAVSPLNTSSIGGSGNANINIGFNANGPNAVYLNHIGDATLQSVFTSGVGTPVDIVASNNLTATNINTGNASLGLSAGNLLSVPSNVTLSGANITFRANRVSIDTSGSPATVNAGAGLAWISPYQSGWGIDLGSVVDNTATTLELSTNELNRVTAGILRLGAVTADGLNVSAAIAPSGTSTLSLESGGTITQAVAGTITETNLAIKALGDVTLDTVANSVTNLAAGIGDATHTNKNFSFKNGALNIGAGIDGLNGISIYTSGTYDPAFPDGVLSLISSGALTQSASALLGNKAVYAEGTKVALTQNNNTGVIAGKATGAATGDTFAYTSAYGLLLSTVNGLKGVQHTNALLPDTYAVVLTGPSISQDVGVTTGAPVSVPTGKGLEVVTTGSVSLPDGNNSVSFLKITGTLTGPLDFQDKAALNFTGITTSDQPVWLRMIGADLTVSGAINAGTGDIDLQGANLTTSANISGGNCFLLADQATTGMVGITGTAAITATGVADIMADGSFSIPATGTITASKIYLSPYTSGRPMLIGGSLGTAFSIPDATDLDESCMITPRLLLGDPITESPTGNITVALNANISRPTTELLMGTGGSITQTSGGTGTIAAKTLGMLAYGNINLPNNNSINEIAAQSVTGTIAVNSGTSIKTVSGTEGSTTISGLNTNNQNITLTSASSITLNEPVTAGTGQVFLTSGGAIVDGNGAGVNNVTVGTLDISAYNNIDLDAQASSVTATSSMGTVTVRPYPPATAPPPPPPPPTIDQCTANPTLSGCSTVLPTLATCTATPTAPGCTAVLPSISTCTTNPTAPGCSAVLPPLADCTTNPALPGCTAVLPTISTCTATPTAPGCSAVLPTIATCTATPTAPGCTAVLPSISTCTTNPTAPGCSAVLPPLADCTTNPALPGCTAILPTLADCATNPTLPGCTAVLPPVLLETPPAEMVATILAVVTVEPIVPIQTAAVNMGTPLPAATPSSDQQSTSGSTGNSENEKNKEGKGKGVTAGNTSQELPLAKQPIFDLNGGGVAGQNMVCK